MRNAAADKWKMRGLVRAFCPAFLALTTISHTRTLILCFDFQCLTIFSLMFLVDPDPYIRIYFLFYLAFFTMPTTYLIVFGDKCWMRIAFICQLTRTIFIALHNVFYPIFVAAQVAVDHLGDEGVERDEILMKATSYGSLIFFMSMTASIWEPAKLYQIYRLIEMLEPFPKPSEHVEIEFDDENDADGGTIRSEMSVENLSLDSGFDVVMTDV